VKAVTPITTARAAADNFFVVLFTVYLLI